MTKNSTPKRRIGAGFFWLLLLIASILFLVSLFTFSLFPKIWTVYAAGILFILLLILGRLSFKYYRSGFVKFLDIILCLALFTIAILMPYYQAKISDLFNQLVGNTTTINLYVMTEEYKQEHPEIFNYELTSSDNLLDYSNGVFASAIATDPDNQLYAIEELEKEIGNGYTLLDKSSIQAAAESLYSYESDVLIMSKAYESILIESEGYEHFREETKVIASFKRTIDSNIRESDKTLTEEPFAIYFGGNDEYGELSLEGRTDVNIVLVVNPQTSQIIMVNMPRDSYVANPAFGQQYDKLTHLGMNGISNTLDSLGDLLGTSINNYVIVNFSTYMQIIDSIDGVDVDNPYAFGYWDNPNIWYEEGPLHLDGEDALWFVRERKTLPDGDFGRIMHQQMVMKAILQKLSSTEVLLHVDDLLDGLNGKFLTNLSSDAIYTLCQKQLKDGMDWNIVSYSIEGEPGVGICAISPEEYLSVVYLYPNQVEFVQEKIKQVINGEIISEEEMPEGYIEN